MALHKLQIKEKEKKSNKSNTNANNQSNEHYIETLVNTVHNSKFNKYYSKENSNFKEKIDQLNLKFYLKSEKYLSNKTSQVKCQDSLFIILFQQIELYIEEIERLNAIISIRKDSPNSIKERIEEGINRQKEFETKEKLIQTLKESNKKLELQLCVLITNEDKLKSEIERLKRQNIFYKDKLQIYLLTKHIDYSNEESVSKYSISKNTSMKNVNSSIKSLTKGMNDNNSNSNGNINNNPSVLNIKQYFVRKRNSSDQNTTSVNQQTNPIITTQQKKQSKIIKTLKENKEVKRNGTRWNSPLIGNKDDKLRNYDPQLNNLFKVECFLKEIKQELFTIKGNEANEGMNIANFESQENSEVNLKTEVISDIEDYEGGYYKNTTLATVNNKEIKRTKEMPKKKNNSNSNSNNNNNCNKANGQITVFGINLQNNNNKGKVEKEKVIYSNTSSKHKKTNKIISNNNGSDIKYSTNY